MCIIHAYILISRLKIDVLFTKKKKPSDNMDKKPNDNCIHAF